MHMRAFVPYNAKNLWHRIACRISEYNFQTKLNKTYMLGPEGPYADFLGLNYYARTATSGLGDGTLPNVPVNDLGWEIYPAGIVLPKTPRPSAGIAHLHHRKRYGR